MHQWPAPIIRSRKVGGEDVILMRLPAERFCNHIPPHYLPPVDKKSRYQVALVVQSCLRSSFDSHELGQSDEFHFWLRTEPFVPDKTKYTASIRLPVQFWFSLATASDNPVTRENLRSFGFCPSNLVKVELEKKGGTAIIQDRGQIDWTINGKGKVYNRVDLEHIINLEADSPDSTGHHIYASISNPVMDQPGRIHIQTTAFEPFLHKEELIAAVVHRMSRLEADIVWRKMANGLFS
jgi:hypothetical protein